MKYAIEKNPQKEDGVTPLHSAAFCGHLEACKVLIEVAHDKEPTIADGQTPADCAKRNNHEEVFKYLTEYLRKK